MTDYRRPSPRRFPAVLWGLALLALVAAGVLLLRHLLSPPPPTPVVAEPSRLRTVTLYFAAPDGSGLVAETGNIAACPNDEACLRATVEALLTGPTGQLAPIFPPRVDLRGVSVAGSEAQVDFSRTLIDSHPGGSLGELLTLYGLATTVVVNFPHLRQVRVLIDGRAVETLKGHVDLRQPLTPDFSLIVNPPAGKPAATSPGSQ